MTPEEIQKRQETIEGVRAVIDWLEANPDTTLPLGFDSFEIWHSSFEEGSKERFLETVKAFGDCEKSVGGIAGRESEFKVAKMFGRVKLTASIDRKQVCTRKVVKKEVEVEEWECEALLSQAEIQQVGQEAVTV